MSGFIARNGVPVVPDGFGGYQFVSTTDFQMGELTGISARRAEALREFFRAEEDKRLGRWRWPENPDYVVYHWDQPQSAGVVVLSETQAVPSRVLYRDSDHENPTPEYRAARAYFDAHPEPWHDAKDGETWALTVNGVEDAWAFRKREWERVSDGYLLRGAPSSPAVTAGRRIWPEDTE